MYDELDSPGSQVGGSVCFDGTRIHHAKSAREQIKATYVWYGGRLTEARQRARARARAVKWLPVSVGYDSVPPVLRVVFSVASGAGPASVSGSFVQDRSEQAIKEKQQSEVRTKKARQEPRLRRNGLAVTIVGRR